MPTTTIVTTRFTNETFHKNIEYRLRKKIKGCVYGSPQEMSPKILFNSLVFVVEMNNSKNQIEGIGLVRNFPEYDKYYNIYDNGNYNRYAYKSNYYVPRINILRFNEMLVECLDYILFKEKTHLKRGMGFTTIPEKLLKHTKCQNINIYEEIKHIFIINYN